MIKIALVGNPNCGKTALFNLLTGSKQKVANYSGVTVEQKKGFLKIEDGNKVLILDLPGTYSLRARSPDEAVTRDVVLGRFAEENPPNAFLCVADATNLHLGLRLVLELKKIGKPIILALNMYDIAERRGYSVNISTLAKELGVPVVPTIAVSSKGISKLVGEINSFSNELEKNGQVSQLNLNEWQEPTGQDVRIYHKEVERILKASNRGQGVASKATEKIDSVLLHPVLGILSLLFILFIMFQAVFSWAKIPQDAIQALFDMAKTFLETHMTNGLLRSLIADGIIAGVGSVLVFIPQIITLFFFILVLEDSGYMARAAFLMDKLMGGVGLNGKSFIPLLSSFACAIPGIMAARTIEHRKDRILTILIAPLMTCSARLPVYTLIISAFIAPKMIFGFINLQGLVMFSLYTTGIIFALLVAFVFKIFIYKKETTFLLLDLPCYKIPRVRNVLLGLLERAKIFLRRAGTIILALMIVIWFLSTFPRYEAATATDPAIGHSFAGIIGKFIEPLLAPIGFNWQMAIALVPGFAAREVAIATLGTIYALSGSEETIADNLGAALTHSWTLPMALSFLTWYIFAPQCASTLAVTKRETNSWFWPFFMFFYMLCLAYCSSFIVYRVALFFT